IADQLAGAPLGFLDPALYDVFNASRYSSAFHDVTTGNNGYAAGAGWDPVTGIGSPIAGVLLPLLAQHPAVYSNLTVRLSASARSGATPLGVSFAVNVTGGTGRYVGFDIAFGDGNSSWSTSAGAAYVYTVRGSYPASVTVFDSGGNSTTSAPVEEIAGGGLLLGVTLTANRTTVPLGGSVAFTVGVTGGTGPYTSVVQYGDGSSALPSPGFSFAHTYGAAGGFCVGADVSDSATPVNGGNSSPIAIAVGGAVRPHCAIGPPLTSGLASNFTLADLPGDFPLRPSYSGGTAPLTAWIESDDTYSTLCQCGVFRTPGVHTVDLVVNDSVGDRTESALSLTLFPALAGSFGASGLSGTVPFTVDFTATLSGGYLANASHTTWSFGDGANATGAAPSHTYTTAGTYLAVADARDAGRGNASEAFLIDVLPATGGGGAPVVTAEVSPAIDAVAGVPVNFTATVTGASGPYSVEWLFPDLSSGFGPSLNETFGWAACGSLPGCPFDASIVVRNAAGLSWSTPVTLDHFLALNGSGLAVPDDSVASTGTTPFPLTTTVGATGMPGLHVSVDYGDGSVLAGASSRHVYLAPGDYTVSEVVQDAGHDYWVRHHALAVNGSRIQPLSTGIALAPTT
ncbi:MAG TPA: PKD domain-containing protein, partial [Acidimicrobiales bacterium]|nr:PKD domain-containing protein [Acidimicrobiales bacterium]